ncbi:MAG TPA: helix-turn-helix domain-containing protein [Burkholderiaceae bacterium]|nr:helix-turn-helix domain-containing protein [Burkholderiaceae bacterium]
MTDPTAAMADRAVPTYALYGEHEAPLAPESLHCESIAARSRLYAWEIRPHRHDVFMQILHIRAGGGEALFEGERVALERPCLVIVPPLAVHGFRFTRNVDGVVVTIAARHMAALLETSPELVARFATPQCERLGSRAAGVIAASVDRLVDEFNGDAPWRLAALEASLLLLLVQVGRALSVNRDAARTGGTRALAHVRRFRALVEQGFRGEREIGFYAARLGITSTQLNRVCRQVLGQSALGVIQNRLLVEAKRDLAYTILSVKEIALTLGFSDAAYFTRFFTQHTGRAPSEFRLAAHRQLAGRRGRSRSRSTPHAVT